MTRDERSGRIERCLRGIANDGCGCASMTLNGKLYTCRDRHPGDPSAWCWSCVAAAEIEAVDASPSPGTEGAREGEVEVPCPGWPECEYVQNPPGHKHYARASVQGAEGDGPGDADKEPTT